ncbi:hypothetical protein CH294_11045 [Rhodococcus sp. 14-2483-1-1]|uniref:hypothetical protein n=1 Tax=Rhodococcus sp. 14-2483-1-1 TaxID=2023148 RepID=UPI000B9BE10F|nr:hypothetical protein [Rhodococcus sp. 14-2483-1-1]OZF36495.1 hypothetical protein CH294_11045 [Rhodococcus sp. 14-2483-1-1]
MRVRSSIGSALLTVVAMAALTACGDNDARPASQAVATSTQVGGAQPGSPVENAPSESPAADEPDTGDGSGPIDASVPAPTAAAPPTQPVAVESPVQDPVQPQIPPVSNPDGDLASTIMGDWQRHASILHLDPDPASSTFTTGASCCDVETWTATYTPIGDDKEDGVVVTLLERTFLAGDGLGGTLYEGKRFEASPSIGYNDTRVLMTYDLGDAPGVNTWCRSGHGVPECGA